ncbi:MAG: response regulator [Winogradskyella sp.]|uniref:ATP-binding response regulator n=1 Tax=Winogradskyella sp. TaxID=1883156 RepID=UPI000F3E57C5|nr:ATP-binding protein [Winogradskyella sp.]RNC84951.1 MAG: response regulator [Winogradskyella sp.]
MSILKSIRESYIEKNTQFILIDNEGIIKESDNVLFHCEIENLITDIHPFFLSINHLNLDDSYDLTCVHLDINNKELICDISVKKHNSYILIIISDFSTHYNSFQSLAQSRNETAIASELMEIENYILNKKQAFKDKFIANFNHELVSPILSLLTFSDALKKTQLTPEQKDYSEIILSSSDTLKNMVNDIFDITKIETGNLDIVNKRFSLKRLVKVIKADYSRRFRRKNLDFEIIYAHDMPDYIVSDKLRVNQIISNLLNNALKYTETGSVTVAIDTVYRRARKLTFNIKVSDTGIGIAKEYHDYIFERFNRLETTKATQGNGLGLSITKDIIGLMGGEINVKSIPNQGSTFTVTFRVTTPLRAPNKESKPENPSNDSTKKEVLLVEDNQSDQLSLFKILASTKSYFIDIAQNGNEAVKMHKQKDYDLILMDYKLNSIDGLEASKLINKGKRNKTPIIMVTGIKINESLLQQYHRYVNDIINKPFLPETLIERIKMHIK